MLKQLKFHIQIQVTWDLQIELAIEKFGALKLPEIDEVNIFVDENTVFHIEQLNVQFSMRERLLVVTGVPESKQLQDMIPDILKQVGPQQYDAIQKLVAGSGADAKGAAGDDDDDDDVPALVNTNFEQVAASKWAN